MSVDGFEGGDPPGLVKVLSRGNYAAVVAKTEWQAIQASHLLKVTWKKPDTPVLPDGYEAGKIRYPAFYLLHGNGADENEWVVQGGIQQAADEMMLETRSTRTARVRK